MEPQGLSRELRIILALAGIVVIVAGMRAAAGIIGPILLSVMIAIVCTPPLLWMHEKKVPTVVAMLLIMLVLIGAGYLLVIIIGAYVYDFTGSIGEYEERISEEIHGVIEYFERYGIDISEEAFGEYLNVSAALDMFTMVLGRLGSALTNLFLILIIVFFILLEVPGLRSKMVVSVAKSEESLQGFDRFVWSVKRYLTIKTFTSLLTGILIGVLLWMLGVRYAPLWGLLAFLLNYVPKIGSFAAAIPAVLIAFIQLGWFHALLAMMGFTVVNTVVGYILEPKVMGRGLGMPTVLVLVALLFWGWVLGPVGLIVAMPLTMMIKTALETSDNTRWIGLMLDDTPEQRLREIEEEC